MSAPFISEFFSYDEFIKSSTAEKHGINNDIPADLVWKIIALTEEILNPVRTHFDKPVIITSGYRCPALNQLISNNKDSQHTKGEAVDFYVKGVPNMDVAIFIRDELDYDQLILERNWIHCSYVKTGNRGDVFRTYDGHTYEKGLYE